MMVETGFKPTILIVDDSDDYRSALRMWLETLNYSVVEAEDGEKALFVARTSQPDLILMDIGMPERSGISATYRLRQDPNLHDVPIVAITGFETEELHRDAVQAGCVECLTKPTDSSYLKALIERLLTTRDLKAMMGSKK